MDNNADQQLSTATSPAASSYALGMLAKACATARGHQDADTRRRAEDKARRWRDVLAGMTSGRVSVGSRTPVAGLPAWVTPEVVHGGFATGRAQAEGPMLPYESAAAREAGVPATRAALFAHHLTGPGLERLWRLLDSGRYEAALPEEAALLTVAWLVRAGDVGAAAELVEELAPFADRLRFTPRPAQAPAPDRTAVHRATAADAGSALAARQPNGAVEAQREALAVWRPFEDELLVHWLLTAEDGEPLRRAPDAAWRERGRELLATYAELDARHTRCARRRGPKGNLGILRSCLDEVVSGRELDARRYGLLRTAVSAMVRKRGLPGSPGHTALRAVQARQAALPSHHALAGVLVRRLADLRQDVGVSDVDAVLGPVTAREQAETGVASGAVVPDVLRRVVEGALSAPLATLVERGVVPSAEVLAELVPQLVAATTAESYADPALRTLAAANYRAFRNRRSLLLLDLRHQVRVDELPWVRAVSGHRAPAGDGRGAADPSLVALRDLGELAVRAFPATILPNPLVRELSALARQAGLRAPLVEELAADIFEGAFTPKFLEAAVVAAELLGGSLYERYYGIDYAAVRALAEAEASGRGAPGVRTSPGFARLCAERAGGRTSSWSVAANGKVIEQSQILTTHNLALLVSRVGIAPEPGWEELARRSFTAVCRLADQAHHQPRPLATIKDAAYAWRQMLFHLSLCPDDTRDRVLSWLDGEVSRHPWHVGVRLEPAVDGLRLVAAGGRFGPDGTADDGRARRLTGWTTERHWMR
ncbi:hypothetical protein ABT160_15995 [Streptomyces sp. NPDC001941]|uniref:hypothetical protein n=1 Tax=Streptomyces sp. NPDC001941 TaxID=3154659 RepID=UPI003330A259